MCDILVALPDATRSGTVVFGKNSDRPAGECQVLYYEQGGDHEPGSDIQCSYVKIPQAEKTLATLGCRPYWCWGYETGMNETGVAGGNTAVFTRPLREEAPGRKPGLTGMELLRLGLERGKTAEQAVRIITDLLEQYGQWGSAVRGVNHAEGSYDNAFLLADRSGAWVLETAGKRWAAERITSGIRSISNQLSIRSRWTDASADLAAYARSRGWCTDSCDFAYSYSDHEHYARQVSHLRWMRSRQLLERGKGGIDAQAMMGFLRDHYEDTFIKGPLFSRYLPDFHTICMHDSPAGFTWGNTATSAVIELDPSAAAPPPFWLCYGPPCSGVFTGYMLGADLPSVVTNTGPAGLGSQPPCDAPQDSFSSDSLWWRFYRLLEAVKQSPDERFAVLDRACREVENRSREKISGLTGAECADLSEYSRVIHDQIEDVTGILAGLEQDWQIT